MKIVISDYFLNLPSKAKLALILLLGAILRVFVSCDAFLHDWDERYHALVAKNFMQHWLMPTLYNNPTLPYNYKSWAENYIWVHKPPLPLWCMSISMRLFGVGEISLRIPSIILSVIAIYLTYRIASELFSNKVGLLAAFFHAINGLVIEITGGRIATDHPDLFFLFFIELGMFYSVLYFKNRKISYNLLIGISMGCAILSKWLPALIIIPFFIALNFDRKNVVKSITPILLIILSATLISLPWEIYIFQAFPNEASWESYSNYLHMVKVLDKQGGPWYFYLQFATINWNELVFIPFIWFTYMLIKNKWDKRFVAIYLWIIIPYLFFSLLQTKMLGYLLFTAPAVFIMIALFWYKLYENIHLLKFKALRLIILILLIVLPIRYCYERVKIFQDNTVRVQITNKLKELDTRIPQINSVIFNDDYSIETMFYSRFTGYPCLPTQQQIDELRSKKVSIYIIKKNDFLYPSYLLNDTEIHWLDL